MINNNISFKSTFRPVKGGEFAKISSKIDQRYHVDFPWTINQAKKGIAAMTTGVADCSVLGITDGQEVLMLHLCPTMSENEDFNKIKEFIKRKIDLSNNYLQGVLLGSQLNSTKSVKLFEFLKSLMEQFKIPCTIMQDCKDSFHVAYSSYTDEWNIVSTGIDGALTIGETDVEKIFKKNFKNVKLSSLDEYA